MWITVGSLVDSNNQKYSCSDKTQSYKIQYRRVGVEIIPSRVRVVSVKPGVDLCLDTCVRMDFGAEEERGVLKTYLILLRAIAGHGRRWGCA